MGATSLMSRTANSILVTTKQTDAQLAREAAESGMNRVLSTLNPYTKHNADPYVSFLLASNWVPDSGVNYNTGVVGAATVRSGWRLTSLDRNTVRGILRQCGLSERGLHPNQQPPSTSQTYADLFSGAIGAAGALTGTQLRYMVTDYVPPTRPASGVAWPTECNAFASLGGGTSQISVEGRVIRNGTLVARYTLTRTIDVQSWSLVNVPASWVPTAYPGPPVGLRIGGTAGSLVRMQSGFYESNFTEAQNVRDLSGAQLPMCRNFCPNGQPFNNVMSSSPGVEMRVPSADVIPANDADLPRYPYDTSLAPFGLVPLQINESRLNYPYRSAGNSSISNLYPECRDSQSANQNSPRDSRQGEIDCWIESIGVPQEVASVAYNKTTNVFTLTLRPDARYDVAPGTWLKVNVRTGGLNSGGTPWRGRVINSSGSPQVITFTPDTQPPASVNTYFTAASPSQNPTFVSPDHDLANPLTLRVNTEARPVNLIIRGQVGTPSADEFVVLKHLVRESPAQGYVHSIAAVNVRSAWSRLRIFGLSRPAASCPTSPGQTFYINPQPVVTANGEESSLSGAFLWLPQGALVYGTAGQSYPQQFLSVWWLCNLDIPGLLNNRPRMTFVTPLNGNPDVLEAVLPGGFLTASGEFIPDLRFPVYPSLQRIRSTY
ncbi:MAG: hypothetical protein ACK6BG_11680 [Cyanobacteriota bacterium]